MTAEDRNNRSLLYKIGGILMLAVFIGLGITILMLMSTLYYWPGLVALTVVCPITLIIAIVLFVMARRARRK